MSLAKHENAMTLLGKCIECGVFSNDSTDEILDVDLVESGVIDSMSLTMLAAMLKKHYAIVITPQQFIAELRTLNDISTYIENND